MPATKHNPVNAACFIQSLLFAKLVAIATMKQSFHPNQAQLSSPIHWWLFCVSTYNRCIAFPAFSNGVV